VVVWRSEMRPTGEKVSDGCKRTLMNTACRFKSCQSHIENGTGIKTCAVFYYPPFAILAIIIDNLTLLTKSP
jgi:hypothetical protein